MIDGDDTKTMNAIVKSSLLGAAALVAISIAGSPAYAVEYDEFGRAIISGKIASQFLPPSEAVGIATPDPNTNCNCGCQPK
jgi:hypothetical protein